MSTIYPLKPLRGEDHARDARDPKVRDGGGHPLSRKQKSMLCALARKAAAASGAPETGEAHAEWRRDVCVAACGRRISEATQRNWNDLKAAFEMGAGRPEAAFETHFRGVDNPRRVAMFHLQQALGEKQLPAAYAEAIARRQYKRGLSELSARELWNLVYTIRNRKKKS